MKNLTLLSLIILSILSCVETNSKKGCKNLAKVTFNPDTTSLIRNPGMGWTIYDDASGPVANADEFWKLQDTIARKYATTLYIRWRWSDMEPEEGRYAWNHDENFKKLVKGALDRGLKLAFRVYVASQDNEYESTPKFVFDAGAKFYMENGVPGKLRSPYPDDKIFQEKFENFIKAFAAKFDNSDIVNYVDGYNLGWWGEGHNMRFLMGSNSEKTFEWITNLYGSNFKNVPLVITVDSQIGHNLELKYAIEKNGYSIRRDGYASYWMPESQKTLIKGLFPKCFVVSECCYWQNRTIESVNKIDKKYNWKSWADYYTQVVDEAIETHGNYLDLREPVEALRWTGKAIKNVKRFIRHGGYRIYPTQISFQKSVGDSRNLQINHEWLNLGNGVLPNNCKAWRNKYKVAFKFTDLNNKVIKTLVSSKSEPSEWINQKRISYTDNFNLKDLPTGKYILKVAIVNTEKNNKAEINLATKSEDIWLKLGIIEVNK